MDEIKKSSIPKWLKVGLLIVGVILVVVGFVKIFGNSGASAFADKFNELQAPGVEMKDDLTSAGNLLNGISAKETEKDYVGIISDLQTAIAKLNNAASKDASMSITSAELQSMISKSSDQNVKMAGARFIDALKSRNVAALKMIGVAKDLVNQATTYYNQVANNQKITINVDEFIATANAFTAEAQSMTNIGAQYEATADDFAKAVGFTIDWHHKIL